MSESTDRTSYCGLYCGDCIPRDKRVFLAVEELKKALDEVQFDQYAYLRSQSYGKLLDYPIFVRVLDEIEAIECKGPCATGGGKKVCIIRDCVKQNGYRGCWECAESSSCVKLARLKRFHAKTIEHNHEMIRLHGIENWADKREKHYPWR
jgi:hypothetical protein